MQILQINIELYEPLWSHLWLLFYKQSHMQELISSSSFRWMSRRIQQRQR